MRQTTTAGALVLALGCCLPGCKEGGARKEAAPVQRAASQQGTAGGVADYDGDGTSDLFVGAPFATGDGTLGAVFVHRGSAAGFADEPTWTLTGGDNFGSQFAAVGDLDGDGFGDYAVAAANGDGPAASLCGTVTVFRGGTSGKVLATLAGEQALDRFGASITGGCDLDGDGAPDLVVGAPSHSPGPDRYLGGAYYLYRGPGLSEASRLKIPATAHAGILGFSSACGDVNGDGIDDLLTAAIWTHGVAWHDSKVLVFYGGSGFAPDADRPDVTIASTATHFGDALAVLDDLDGDGYREIAIGLPSFYAIPAPSPANPMNGLKGRVFLVKGGTGPRAINLSPPPGTPLPSDVISTLTGADYLERFGSTIAPVGDLDADGKPDFAVGAPHGHAPGATSLDTGWVSGRVYLFLGKDVATGGAGTPATAATVLSRPGRTLHFGSFLVPFARGGARLLVGAPTADRQSGAVFVEDLTTAVP